MRKRPAGEWRSVQWTRCDAEFGEAMWKTKGEERRSGVEGVGTECLAEKGNIGVERSDGQRQGVTRREAAGWPSREKRWTKRPQWCSTDPQSSIGKYGAKVTGGLQRESGQKRRVRTHGRTRGFNPWRDKVGQRRR